MERIRKNHGVPTQQAPSVQPRKKIRPKEMTWREYEEYLSGEGMPGAVSNFL